jgi:hypothetical protein
VFVDEFKKFIGRNYYIIGNGTSERITDVYHFRKWFFSRDKKRTSGKAQRVVDELIKLPLGGLCGLEHKYLPQKHITRWSTTYTNNVIYYERVNDELSVLRALILDDNGNFDEAWRVYLGDDGMNVFATKVDGDWLSSQQSRGWNFNREYYFANEQEAINKCDRIKYMSQISSPSDGMRELLTTLRFPCIEQLYKLGHAHTALSIARSSTPKAKIKAIFGHYNEKEKSILRQIGMTKAQLDAYEMKRRIQNSYRVVSALSKMREIFGDDLSRIDYDTFTKYLDALTGVLCGFHSDRYLGVLNVDIGKFWKNVVRLHSKNNFVAQVLSDTINDYNYLDTPRPNIDWLFDDYSDLVRAHDMVTALKREQDAQRRAYWSMSQEERNRKTEEKRKKVDEGRKHYEYEDEHFIIRLPRDTNEIVEEGTRQSICIGGYTSRHGNGETNLFFLRRKDAENTPFYAIEMNNNKTIVQIHGYCNRWLGNNPEAIPTVVRWLRKHGIQCNQQILTCTATGYGRTNNYIAMPIVD